MVSITTRQGSNGLIWRVQYRVDGRLIERTFHSRMAAQEWAATAPTKGRMSNATVPDSSHPRPLRARSCTAADNLIAEAEFMLSLGRGLDYLADAFNMQRASVERALQRASRHDLITRDRKLTAREAA